jgi:glycosyltransferase involved in cell wall biosynthesis
MRIAIDARELAGQPTGVGRFLSEILREWLAMPDTALHEFILCAPAPPRIPEPSAVSAQPLRPVETAVAPGHGTTWEQRVLPRLAERSNADVLFCPAYSGPISGRTPMVVAIHDVSFAAHPEWFRWREGLRRRFVTRRAAARATRIVTISEFSRREIVEHLGVPASKIDVVYPGVTRHPLTAGPESASPQRGAAGQPSMAQPVGAANAAGPLVLYVGSIFNRRHVPETIRGFARMARRHPDARFAIVGDNRTFPSFDLDGFIAATKGAETVSLASYVDERQLAALYHRARAFVFLSEYEGFGLTPLEALGAGVPIVVLDTPVAREVYRDAAIYLARPDPHLIAPALEQALFDEDVRARILAASAAVLARYSWRECAHGVLRALTA